MTTYASLLKKKSSFITLQRKGLQLTEKSPSYCMHFTFYYMMIETELIVAQMSCKVYIFAQYITTCAEINLLSEITKK